MDLYCSKCGNSISNSLFCEECGELTSNMPSSFSSEESLAGLIVTSINQRKLIKFSELKKIENNPEKIFRIFAQLERTLNYYIIQEENDFALVLRTGDTKKIKLDMDKKLLKNLSLIVSLNEEDKNQLFR